MGLLDMHGAAARGGGAAVEQEDKRREGEEAEFTLNVDDIDK